MHTVFGEEREHLQDLGIDGKIILNIILNTYCGGGRGGGWVAQDRLERRTLINTKIKIIHKAIKYEAFMHYVGTRYPLDRNCAGRSQ